VLTRGRVALARPGLVAACSGASRVSLGTLGLARVLVLSFDGEHWLVQESEKESVDMVGRQGVDQTGFGHVWVSCTYGRTWLCTVLCKW
jgi:hypothetical protein